MIKVLGHRGCRNGKTYENSLKAFRFALEMADGLETDLIKSADQDIFMAHDTDYHGRVVYELSRHLNKESAQLLQGRRLDEISSEEARNLCIIDQQNLPSLQDLDHLCGQFQTRKTINLELKGPQVADPLLKGLNKTEHLAKHDIIVSSFDHAQLAQVRELQPTMIIGALFAQPDQEVTKMHPWNHGSEGFYIPFQESYIAESTTLRAINPQFFNLEKSLATDAVIDRVLKYYPDSAFIFWTMGEDDPELNHDWLRALTGLRHRDKVYAVISDYPRKTKKLLQSLL